MDLSSLDHDRFARQTLTLAREAAERGDDPFGALLVHDGEVVAEDRNAVHSADDIRRHPELTLAHRAAREFDAETRSETVLYTSTEPCSMCGGGIYIAGLGAAVYAVSAEGAAEAAGEERVVPPSPILEESGVDVVGPVLPEAGAQVHRDCW